MMNVIGSKIAPQVLALGDAVFVRAKNQARHAIVCGCKMSCMCQCKGTATCFTFQNIPAPLGSDRLESQWGWQEFSFTAFSFEIARETMCWRFSIIN